MSSDWSPRLVVVNGCSLTYGARLADPQAMCWGRRVADGLGADFVNLAAGSGSNARLVRTSVNALPALVASGVPARDILFIAMWTQLSRTEVRVPDADLGHRPDGDDPHWKRIGPWRLQRGDEQSELYYRRLQSDDGDLETFLVGWILLDAFLSRLGVRAAYCLGWNILPPDAFTRHPVLTHQLDDHRLFGGFDSCRESSFARTVKRGGFPEAPDKHPREDGHRYYAEQFLLPWLRRLP